MSRTRMRQHPQGRGQALLGGVLDAVFGGTKLTEEGKDYKSRLASLEPGQAVDAPPPTDIYKSPGWLRKAIAPSSKDADFLNREALLQRFQQADTEFFGIRAEDILRNRTAQRLFDSGVVGSVDEGIILANELGIDNINRMGIEGARAAGAKHKVDRLGDEALAPGAGSAAVSRQSADQWKAIQEETEAKLKAMIDQGNLHGLDQEQIAEVRRLQALLETAKANLELEQTNRALNVDRATGPMQQQGDIDRIMAESARVKAEQELIDRHIKFLDENFDTQRRFEVHGWNRPPVSPYGSWDLSGEPPPPIIGQQPGNLTPRGILESARTADPSSGFHGQGTIADPSGVAPSGNLRIPRDQLDPEFLELWQRLNMGGR